MSKRKKKKAPYFHEVAEEWLQKQLSGGADGAYTYRTKLKPVIDFQDAKGTEVGLGRWRLSKLTSEHILRLQRTWAKKQKGLSKKALSDGYAPATILQMRQLIAAIGKYARSSENKKPSWPFPELPTEKPKNREKVPGASFDKVIEEEAVLALLGCRAQLGLLSALVWTLLLLGGMRSGELRALRWENIKFSKKPMGQIVVAFGIKPRTGKRGETKTKEPRRVPVHARLLPLLEDWKKKTPRPDEKDYVLVNKKGQTISSQRLRDWLREDLEKLQIENDHTPHHCRHTMITLLSSVDGVNTLITNRVTHQPKKGDAIEGYRLGIPWKVICREYAKWEI